MLPDEMDELIDQAELHEDCPCGETKSFGYCCGAFFMCDCNSKLLAMECCYEEEVDEERTG